MPPKTPPPIPTAAALGPRWEYKVLTLEFKFVANVEQVLNSLGDQCWEMIDMVRDDSNKVIITLKRKKRPA
jgi:hypothetical protein